MGENESGTNKQNARQNVKPDMDERSKKKNSYSASEREALILRIRESMKLKRENEDLKHEISSLNKEVSKRHGERNMKLHDFSDNNFSGNEFSDNRESQKNPEQYIKQSGNIQENFQQIKQIPNKEIVNTDAEVIGITFASYSINGAFTGIGFAVPINMAKDNWRKL